MGLAVQGCIEQAHRRGSSPSDGLSCPQFWQNSNANCSNGETDISKSRLLSEYPMICFPELLQTQKHLPVGEEPLTTCGAGILPSSREGEHTEARQTEELIKVCLIPTDFGILTELSQTYRKEKKKKNFQLYWSILCRQYLESHYDLSNLESHTPTICPGSGGINPHGPGIVHLH